MFYDRISIELRMCKALLCISPAASHRTISRCDDKCYEVTQLPVQGPRLVYLIFSNLEFWTNINIKVWGYIDTKV